MTLFNDYEITGPLFDEDPGVQECQRCPNKLPINDLVACIQCGVILCPECSRHFSFEDYCESCAVCNFCGNEASLYCEMCSELICPEHVRERYEVDDATNYREASTRCMKCH